MATEVLEVPKISKKHRASLIVRIKKQTQKFAEQFAPPANDLSVQNKAIVDVLNSGDKFGCYRNSVMKLMSAVRDFDFAPYINGGGNLVFYGALSACVYTADPLKRGLKIGDMMVMDIGGYAISPDGTARGLYTEIKSIRPATEKEIDALTDVAVEVIIERNKIMFI